MTWHYLPVYVEHPDGRFYGLCEVYLDASGKLSSWTETVAIPPVGNDIEDLRGSIVRMANDIDRWKPEKYDDLHVGQVFEKIGK